MAYSHVHNTTIPSCTHHSYATQRNGVKRPPNCCSQNEPRTWTLHHNPATLTLTKIRPSSTHRDRLYRPRHLRTKSSASMNGARPPNHDKGFFFFFLKLAGYIGRTKQLAKLLRQKIQERMGQPVLTPIPRLSAFKRGRHKVMRIAP